MMTFQVSTSTSDQTQFYNSVTSEVIDSIVQQTFHSDDDAATVVNDELLAMVLEQKMIDMLKFWNKTVASKHQRLLHSPSFCFPYFSHKMGEEKNHYILLLYWEMNPLY